MDTPSRTGGASRGERAMSRAAPAMIAGDAGVGSDGARRVKRGRDDALRAGELGASGGNRRTGGPRAVIRCRSREERDAGRAGGRRRRGLDGRTRTVQSGSVVRRRRDRYASRAGGGDAGVSGRPRQRGAATGKRDTGNDHVAEQHERHEGAEGLHHLDHRTVVIGPSSTACHYPGESPASAGEKLPTCLHLRFEAAAHDIAELKHALVRQ